jgi:4-diphosphocytidyl-2-C-methyl-D-erythritol kinase
MIVEAPAKLNLCIYLGPRRPDGLHELVSIFCPLTLADRIEVAEAEADDVICAGVEGPNLAAAALTGLRERDWSRPPVRIEIEKRIPVAAGLGGGSADAAAVLRLAAGEVEGLEELAAELGADVPSQLDPVPALVGGAGERVEPIAPPGEVGVIGLASDRGLATAEVYAAADRLGIGRTAEELRVIERRLREAADGGGSPLAYAELLRNDLEQAALALRPEIGERLAALRGAGAEVAMVAGSGPTAVGLFGTLATAESAFEELEGRWGGTFVAALGGARA